MSSADILQHLFVYINIIRLKPVTLLVVIAYRTNLKIKLTLSGNSVCKIVRGIRCGNSLTYRAVSAIKTYLIAVSAL